MPPTANVNDLLCELFARLYISIIVTKPPPLIIREPPLRSAMESVFPRT